MSFEPTSDLNKERLTIKQHFHMSAILKRFTTVEGIRVQHKADGRIEYLEADNTLFLGLRAWSQEGEVHLLNPDDEALGRVQGRE